MVLSGVETSAATAQPGVGKLIPSRCITALWDPRAGWAPNRRRIVAIGNGERDQRERPANHDESACTNRERRIAVLR